MAMPFVTQIAEDAAGPELKPIYQQIRDTFGFIPNYFLAQGRAPNLITAQIALGMGIVEDAALPRPTKEQIGLVVSGANTSSYCVALHMELLRTMGIEKALGRKLATNYAGAPVEDKVKLLFQFADKLTRRPQDIEEKDATAVREAWGEAALFETVLACALFNFYNRVSIGLGLMPDF
jgi:uncharacterized peroxidase-related enzyme